MENSNNGETRISAFSNKGKIAARFRNMTLLLFAVAFIVIAAIMFFAFRGVIYNLTADYSRHYAAGAAEALSAHIGKEVGLLSKAAHSEAVIAWINDEANDAKRAAAYEELAAIVDELYSINLYLGMSRSMHEYKVEEYYASEHMLLAVNIDPGDPQYRWYFDCITSDKDFIISIGLDDVMNRKRVWLDYKVMDGDVPIGVLCTGLDFSHMESELFTMFEDDNLRGLVIGADGLIHMDSTLYDEKTKMWHDSERRIDDEFENSQLLDSLQDYIAGIDGYFNGSDSLADGADSQVSVTIASGEYHNITISPIKYTDWFVAILAGSISRYNLSLFTPVMVAVLVLLLAFTLAVIITNNNLIFLPIARLGRSLPELEKSLEAKLYGADREDEIGELSRTIRDLFTKANVDALTGIHNRRYIENSLTQTMEFLSRSNGLLSVLMVDIDFFKRFNDTYGHDNGDICLKSVAAALAGAVSRSNDYVARYGGEEFLAVLPNTDEAGARSIAQKLLDNVRELDIPHSGNDAAPCVTISIGVTTGKVAFTQRRVDYVKRADEALYMSKQSGRNKFTYLDMDCDNDTTAEG